ncbi:MAG: cytochrome P450 [Deltaproteobacteria bacterium]|nr:cytochrome P450 [Deltaproteobacteria bacterium]
MTIATPVAAPSAPLGPPQPVPRLKGGFPLLGRTLDLGKDPLKLLMTAIERHGEVAALPMALGKELVLLSGPEAQQFFFYDADEQLSQKEAYKFSVPVFGEGVAYDTTPERMMEQIGFALPALQDRTMRTYAPKMTQEIDAFVERWGDSGEVDLLFAMKELSIYIASRCLLGQEIRERLDSEFSDLFVDLEKGFNPFAFFWPNAPLPGFRKRDRARARLSELIGAIVDERLTKGERHDDMLQCFIDARYSDGTKLSIHEIAGLLIVLLFAGHHTSSTTAAWTGIELHRNPEALANVVKEVRASVATGKPLDYYAVRSMDHIDWSVKETLRMHPPLILLMRAVMSEVRYKDWVFPAGSMLLASPLAAGRLPGVFPEPERFRPERFAPPDPADKLPFAWIPFGGGRHKCRGISFALNQIKTIWARLLHHFEFELVESDYPPDYAAMVVGPKHPARVRYRRLH